MVIFLKLLLASLLEVGGDAIVRMGLRGKGVAVVLLGCLVLGAYGIMVNSVRWDFSRLLGVYVALFAVVSIAIGHFAFKEAIPASVWLGMAFIVTGGLIIQFGAHH